MVRFEVEPMSINFDELKAVNNVCMIGEDIGPQEVHGDVGTKLLFTYSVEWQESAVVWASRWDIFLNMKDVKIHWFSIINSIVVLFFLSGIFNQGVITKTKNYILKFLFVFNFNSLKIHFKK